jgi:hypothetical protein
MPARADSVQEGTNVINKQTEHKKTYKLMVCGVNQFALVTEQSI